MPVTQTDVANMALDILTEGAIDSLDEDTKAARILSRHFDTTVQSELKSNAWIFAILSTSLTGTDLGDDGLNWQFEMPPDALRLLPMTYDGRPDGTPINFKQEGGYLYTDQDSPRIIRYIANVTNPDDWDANFTEVVAAKLAMKAAHGITGKASMVELAKAMYNDALAQARRVNAIEKNGRLYRESWLFERGDLRFARP